MRTLVALLDGREVGYVRQQESRLTFIYEDSWRTAPGAYPLSLSLPLASKDHPHGAINPFLWGLLPDNEIILDRWARRFHVSARNPFALLNYVGEDCPGAVQLATPDRVEELRDRSKGEIQWLTDSEIAERLKGLQKDISAWRASTDTGQFSLAGAQPKTAFYYEEGRWGIPSGALPTTHILKPPNANLDGHPENEHICLQLAKALGLPTATSKVQTFEGIPAIVIERYDRVRISDLATAEAARAASNAAEAAMHAANPEISDDERARLSAVAAANAADAATSAAQLRAFADSNPIYRVHQEDLCQSMRILPTAKYENQGGPSAKAIVELLRSSVFGGNRYPKQDEAAGDSTQRLVAVQEDIQVFVDALIYNWLIGGTDAHAKNYSLLLGAGGLVRLAPLYDLASVLAYPTFDIKKVKLAMKIGGKYRLHRIGTTEWRKCAKELRVEPTQLLDRIREMATALPDHLSTVIRSARQDGISHSIMDALMESLIARAKQCRMAIETSVSA